MRNQYMDSFIKLQAQVNALVLAQRLDLKDHFEKERIEIERKELEEICKKSTK
jgi:hypothetical protein